MSAGVAAPSSRRAIVTTSWDDGHPAELRLADLLEKHGIPATLYIPRANPLNDLPVLEARQIRTLADRGFELGAHTLNHAVLPPLTDAVLRDEVAGSRAWLEDLTGKPCTMFCPPTGRHGQREIDAIGSASFTGYRTVELWSIEYPRQQTNGLFEIPTTLTALPQPAISIAKNLTKRRAVRNLGHYLRHGLSGSWTDHAHTMLDRAVATGGVFHLWGHSWELEAFDEWENLESVLKRIARTAAEGRVRLMTNGELCAVAQQTQATATQAAVTQPA